VRSAIASNSRFRWPSEVTPSSFRSASVSLSKIYVVFGKALGVLPETELLKPISHLLHESAPDYWAMRPHR
jgi:hypothetical protein